MNDKANNDPVKPSSSSKSLFENPMGMFVENLVDVFSQAAKYTAHSTKAITGGALFKTPENLELMGKAGKALKDLRETAGLSLEELSSSIDIDNPSILKSIEEGKAALPIDLMLRLASLYSRNDPIPFIIRFSHTYYPGLEDILKKTGIGNLLIEAERELKFINMYRSADAARKLSNEGFDRVLDFTRKAFLMALHFVSEQENLEEEQSPDNDDENDA